MFKNADASVIKSMVETAIDDYFAIGNWDLGKPLYVSEIYSRLMAIDGIKYVNISNPNKDILPSNKLYESTNDSSLVAMDEIIVQGQVNLKFYYE